MKRIVTLILLALTFGCVPIAPPRVTPTPDPIVTAPAPATFAVTVVVTDQRTGRPVRADITSDAAAPWRARTNSAGFLRRDALSVAGWQLCAEAEKYITACEAITEAKARVVVFSLVSVTPPVQRPERAQLLDYRGCLGTLRDEAGRVVWTPALPGAPADVRREWLSLLRAAGCTHVPIGPFGPGPSYPGIVAWDNPDWRTDSGAIRGLLDELLTTDAGDGYGFRPVIFTDGGPRNPKPRVAAFFPVLSRAIEGIDENVIVLPAGWEPVVGDFTSAEVSWALETWHALRPKTVIAYHGSPERLVGSSNPLEPDDPWQGGESEFYTKHGGQYIDIALYQTPHGRELYEPCGRTEPFTERDGVSGFRYPSSCFLNRWDDYVARIGAGLCTDDIGRAAPCGWRKLPIVLFEVATYETTRGQRTAEEALAVVRRARDVCVKYGVKCGYGDGQP